MSETLREMMAGMKKEQESQGACLKEVHTAIYGDNGDGLKVKVAKNTQFRRSWRHWLGPFIAICALAAMIIFGIMQYGKELSP